MPRRKKQVQEHFPYAPTAILGLDDVYAVIHYVQIARKDCSFLACQEDAVIMENLFADCQINFKRLPSSNGIKYALTPPPIKRISEEAFLLDEEYEDEIVEDGQCF
jgi:hypothetical protein